MILVKGSSNQEILFMGRNYTYLYNYSVTFRMRDNKYKMTLDNVYCEYSDATRIQSAFRQQ